MSRSTRYQCPLLGAGGYPRYVDNSPIGIFDSGVGGLTVARSILDQLPHESIHYIGDTANSPYGSKSLATVRSLALEIMDDLVRQGVKVLVIACNTASAAVLRDARERYTVNLGIPVVEVILPAARRALAVSHTKNIGVVGTTATIASRAYDDALSVTDVSVTSAACPKFVQFVEAGVTSGSEVIAAAQEYLAPIKQAHVDTLILGCTHYPLLTGAISFVMGDEVTLVSSAEETAKDVYRTLMKHDIERDPETGPPEHRFQSTGDSQTFATLARRFLGPEVVNVESI